MSSESALINGLKSQEPQAVQAMIDFATTKGIAYCRVRGLSEFDAEDVVLDTVTSVILKIYKEGISTSVQSDEQLRGYFFAVLRNKLFDLQRKKRRIVALPEDLMAEPSSSLMGLHRSEWTALISEALKNLSPSERQLVFLYIFESKTSEEIARSMNLSQSTVRVKLHRAIRRLRKILAEGGAFSTQR